MDTLVLEQQIQGLSKRLNGLSEHVQSAEVQNEDCLRLLLKGSTSVLERVERIESDIITVTKAIQDLLTASQHALAAFKVIRGEIKN